MAEELVKGWNKQSAAAIVLDVWPHACRVWAPYVCDGLVAGLPLGLVVGDGIPLRHPIWPPSHSFPWVSTLVLSHGVVRLGF